MAQLAKVYSLTSLLATHDKILVVHHNHAN